MEKTYNNVNWEFILYLLGRYSFGERWCLWIIWCISTIKFLVFVNGNPIDFFNNSQGLRQGDSLASFHFVIVMEALSRMILVLVHHGFMVRFCAGDSSRDLCFPTIT